MIVICGPTQAERVKPSGEKVIALQADMNCFDENEVAECMSKVTTEMVLDALEILEK